MTSPTVHHLNFCLLYQGGVYPLVSPLRERVGAISTKRLSEILGAFPVELWEYTPQSPTLASESTRCQIVKMHDPLDIRFFQSLFWLKIHLKDTVNVDCSRLTVVSDTFWCPKSVWKHFRPLASQCIWVLGLGPVCWTLSSACPGSFCVRWSSTVRRRRWCSWWYAQSRHPPVRRTALTGHHLMVRHSPTNIK